MREQHGVNFDLHGCTYRHAAEYRTFDVTVNAALRAGVLLWGNVGPLEPCPPLGRLGCVDTCISAEILLRERGAPSLARSAWRNVLLAKTLVEKPPDRAAHHAALRSANTAPGGWRRACPVDDVVPVT